MSDRDGLRSGAKSTDSSPESIESLVAYYVERLTEGELLDPDEIRGNHADVADALLATLELFVDAGSDDRVREPLGTLGDYTLRRQIGRGGMGVVYEAWENSMGRTVALKVLPAGLAADDRAVTRFIQEARLAGKISHPNVVAVHGMGVNEQTPYYAMEFVTGETLSQILARVQYGVSEEETPFGPNNSATYFDQLAGAFADVADGLQHAHQEGVVHRDIKPSNLILDRNGRLRILDFGLARLEGQESLTLSGDFIGTPRYMSPEQARRKKVTVDHRTDVYSLGATMYEAICGRPPFRGKDHVDTLSQIIERDPAEPRKVNPRVSKDLETIVSKCLRKAPADRYGTAEALAQDLRRFVRGHAIEARPRPDWECLLRRAWYARTRLTVAGLVLLLLTAVGVLFIQHHQAQQKAIEQQYGREVVAGVLRLKLGEMTVGAGSGAKLSISPQGLFREGDLDQLVASSGVSLNPIHEGLARLAQATSLLPSRPESYYHSARGLKLLGRRDEAITELDRAIRVAPDFVPAIVLRSELEAEAQARSIDQPYASSWGAAWIRAHEAAAAGRWDEAAKAYEKLVERIERADAPYFSASIECYLGLGIARFKQKELHGALESFVGASALWPQASEPRLLIGMVYLEMGESDLAEATFEDLYARREVLKDEVALWVAALQKYYKQYVQGRRWAMRVKNESIRLRLNVSFSNMIDCVTETVQLCREAIHRFPHDQRFHHSLAVALLRSSGRQKEALEVARKAHDMDPDRVGTVCLLAAAYEENGERKKAESLLRDTIVKFPNEPRPYDQLGRCYFARHKIEAAERLYLRAVELVEKHPHHHILDPMLNWGGRLLALGRVNEAVEMYERSIAAHPTQAGGYAKLAKLFKMQGEFELAETMCRKALKLDPDHGEVLRDLGLTLWANGHRGEAVETLERAFARNPAHTYAHASLAWARDELGQWQNSFEDCVRSVEAAPSAIWNHWRLFHLQHRDVDESVFVGQLWDRVATVLEPQTSVSDAPPSMRATLVLARLYGDAAQNVEAALELAEKLTPSDPFSRVALASALFENGRLSEAVVTLEDILTLKQVPGFVPGKLRAYRDEALPDLASLATADWFLASSKMAPVELLECFHASTTDSSQSGSDAIATYLRGRALQLAGRFGDAVQEFELLHLSGAATPSHLPALRVAECLRAQGRAAEAASTLRDELAAESASEAAWASWLDLSLHSLGLSPDAVVASFPASASGYGAQLQTLLECLASGEAVRINCGGAGFVDSAGQRWEADCFFLGGTPQPDRFIRLSGEPSSRLYRSRRVFLSYEAFSAYRVPLPRGRYGLRLHMAETLVNGGLFPKRFHVVMGSQRLLDNVGPRGFATATTFDVEVVVEDGMLEIEFEAVTEHPAVSGIEIRKID